MKGTQKDMKRVKKKGYKRAIVRDIKMDCKKES